MPRRERRILEELVYERVRLAVDPGELTAFATDLARSIRRGAPEAAGAEGHVFARRLLVRAWRRVGNDLLDAEPADELELR
jgi:hypothetical protein